MMKLTTLTSRERPSRRTRSPFHSMQVSSRQFLGLLLAPALLGLLAGCHSLPPVLGNIHTDADVAARFNGSVEVKLPTTVDPGPVVPVVVRPGSGARVALIDVDGLLLNQNLSGLYSVGENPVSAFREKLEAAARDPAVRAVVLRINSPGGGVTPSDIMAEELRRFRASTGKPTVACMLDLATGGAYYLAIGCDRVIAHPTTITGGVGAIVNHYNLGDAMAQMNIVASPIKSGELVDMGTVLERLEPPAKELLQESVDGFRDRFLARVKQQRRTMTAQDRTTIADGRVVPAPKAVSLHMVDRLGYIEDAIEEASRLAGTPGAEVVLFQRMGYPTRSLYAITPNVPLQSEIVPVSYPGLDRAKLPTFLYLWQPDPTMIRLGGR